VRRAQQILIQQGYLRTEQGRGAFVVAHPPTSPTEADRIATAIAAIDEAMRQPARARLALGPDMTAA
jgi:DNA-binding GntR family transcriptional regulator